MSFFNHSIYLGINLSLDLVFTDFGRYFKLLIS
nr:MAG TPA: METHYL-COENZYME M REDUCTASE I ALPHA METHANOGENESIS, NI-ENZYME, OXIDOREDUCTASE, NI [Caudoviricetes sp.]DAS72476.1 MAG TPA: METHYL-COENZYME M REDUCTASE I ALPHA METHANOGENESIS, NI-ENZYME, OXIDOREDUCTASE, NI [Caudoviricetes sp.]